ncbi:hypothetical protein LTR09_005107 [Extremus antarcticus]|uniref:Uncharacterized protein n=1 Tax=Extremus antarcticus TaxID=702011 RepID=A0AAJ0DH88_9PEZI|nr:hypothetical protein LTR09_005107 [Extremus antarcticus]
MPFGARMSAKTGRCGKSDSSYGKNDILEESAASRLQLRLHDFSSRQAANLPPRTFTVFHDTSSLDGYNTPQPDTSRTKYQQSNMAASYLSALTSWFGNMTKHTIEAVLLLITPSSPVTDQSVCLDITHFLFQMTNPYVPGMWYCYMWQNNRIKSKGEKQTWLRRNWTLFNGLALLSLLVIAAVLCIWFEEWKCVRITLAVPSAVRWDWIEEAGTWAMICLEAALVVGMMREIFWPPKARVEEIVDAEEKRCLATEAGHFCRICAPWDHGPEAEDGGRAERKRKRHHTDRYAVWHGMSGMLRMVDVG